ncbi:hypothetical protein HanRHA438_Chr01g0029571 [Helianthus annuus]|nr:hypothetical protein HanRHA438_Chr01g0029571 [Helianthus annuus]
MFGPNEMKAGDNIIIECYMEEEEEEDSYYIIDYKTECGVDVVYNDGSMEEDVLSYYKSWNHIIGGDLSAFQLTTGEYYLCNKAFTRDSTDEYDPFIGEEGSHKEKEVMFKAFSTKKSEIVGSQAQCSQKRPTAMPPAEAPCMPMFPQGLGQQTFDGQALVPGMTSDGGPMANFYMPMVPTCQQEPRPGGSRAGVSGPLNHQQPLSLMQQQMEPYGLMYPHPPGSDTGNVSMGSVQYDVENAGGIFALTNASPTEQRTAQCSQMGPTRAAPAGASCVPMFLPALGQAQPTFIPPQLGFGHRYQLVPGQHGPRPGGSHVGFHGQ